MLQSFKAASQGLPSAVGKNRGALTQMRYITDVGRGHTTPPPPEDTSLRFDSYTQEHTAIPKAVRQVPAFTFSSTPPAFRPPPTSEPLYHSPHAWVVHKDPSISVSINSAAQPIRSAVANAAVDLEPILGERQLFPLATSVGTSGPSFISSSAAGAQLFHAAAAAGLIGRRYRALLDVSDAAAYGSPLAARRGGLLTSPLTSISPTLPLSTNLRKRRTPSGGFEDSFKATPTTSFAAAVPREHAALLRPESTLRVLDTNAAPVLTFWRAVGVGGGRGFECLQQGEDTEGPAGRLGGQSTARGDARLPSWRYSDGEEVPLVSVGGRLVMEVELCIPLGCCADVRTVAALRPPYGLAAPVVGDVELWPLPRCAPLHIAAAAKVLEAETSLAYPSTPASTADGRDESSDAGGGDGVDERGAPDVRRPKRLYVPQPPSLSRGGGAAPLCLKVDRLAIPDVMLLLEAQAEVEGGRENGEPRVEGSGGGGGEDGGEEAEYREAVRDVLQLLRVRPPSALELVEYVAACSSGRSSSGDAYVDAWVACVAWCAGCDAAQHGLLTGQEGGFERLLGVDGRSGSISAAERVQRALEVGWLAFDVSS